MGRFHGSDALAMLACPQFSLFHVPANSTGASLRSVPNLSNNISSRERVSTFTESSFLRGSPPVLIFILGLLGRRRPAHISRLVMPIVVDAVDGVFRPWRIADVLIERLKGWKQKLDSSVSVIPLFKRSVSLQSLLNVIPSPVDFRSGLPVFCAGFFAPFFPQASTTAAGFWEVTHKHLFPDYAGIATITSAEPTNGSVWSIFCSFDDSPATESLTGQIYRKRHGGI